MKRKTPEAFLDKLITFLFQNYYDPNQNPVTNLEIYQDAEGRVRFSIVGYDVVLWENNRK